MGHGRKCNQDGKAVDATLTSTCAGCGRAGYVSDWPGEGEPDDDYPCILCAGKADGSCTDEYFCDDCARTRVRGPRNRDGNAID